MTDKLNVFQFSKREKRMDDRNKGMAKAKADKSKEGLIEYLAEALDCWKREAISINEKIRGHEMHDQIVALVKKPEATEEWIEERARKIKEIIADLFNANYSLEKCKDFIRVFAEEIHGRKQG